MLEVKVSAAVWIYLELFGALWSYLGTSNGSTLSVALKLLSFYYGANGAYVSQYIR